jgi:peptidoglycan/xylan/chitin deacetylase (PgdA/CDA1 family)
LSRADQHEEISGSRNELRELTGADVRWFAYPYGQPSTYSSETVELVRAAGFQGACANVPGAVATSSNPFELPRVYVEDCGGDEFERRLLSAWRVQVTCAAD